MAINPFPHRQSLKEEVRSLREHIKQLEAKIMDLAAHLNPPAFALPVPPIPARPRQAERTAWNTDTALVPIVPARLRPTRLSQPLEHRQIARVIITPSHKIMAFDQAGLPWKEYCGEFRRVGWRVLQAFKGRWTEVDYEVELPSQTHALSLVQ